MVASSGDWARQGPVTGGWIGADSPAVVDALRGAGFDFVVLDTQHGALSLEGCAGILTRVAGDDYPVVVRVDSNDPAKIGKALDLGAAGVIVPLVETPEQAAAAAEAALFPPRGRRSYGPVRSDLAGASTEVLDRRSLLFVMIETELGLENAEAIAATPGVAGVFVGPADLSIALGLDPFRAFDTDQLRPHFDVLRDATARHGILLGSLGTDAASVQRWRDYGCRFVAVMTGERQLLRAAADSLAATHLPAEENRNR